MNQSQTNTPRSEVISWTSFLTHSSSKRQVLYCWFWFCSAAPVVVHLLQKCSRPSPALLQEGRHRNVILWLQLLQHSFSCLSWSSALPFAQGKISNTRGLSVSSVQTFSSSAQTWRKIQRLQHHSGVCRSVMLRSFPGPGPKEVPHRPCVSPLCPHCQCPWAQLWSAAALEHPTISDISFALSFSASLSSPSPCTHKWTGRVRSTTWELIFMW